MSANRVFGVHTVGQYDVDYVYFRIIPDGIVVLVVVDAARFNAIALSQLICFVGMTADQSDRPGLLAFGEGRQDLIDGKAAEADNGPASFLAGRVWNPLGFGRPCDNRGGVC